MFSLSQLLVVLVFVALGFHRTHALCPTDACNSTTCATTISSKSTFARGDQIQLIVHLNGTGVTAVKSFHYPCVDTFSLLHINGSGLDYKGNSNVTMYVTATANGVSNVTSAAKSYVSTDGTSFVTYWTIYVALSNGVLQYISFDDGCEQCPSQPCVDSTCAIAYTTISSTTADQCTNAKCDMLIYVAFIGTDSSGRNLLSGGSVFSRFRQFAVNPLWETASAWVLSQANQLSSIDFSNLSS